MGLTAEKLARLRVLLSALPAGVSARLAVAVEADRRAQGKGLPHDFILETLRRRSVTAADKGANGARPGTDLILSEVGELARAANLHLRDDGKNLEEVVAVLLERAPYEIARALPVRANGSFASTVIPDFSRPVPHETVENAMRYARLMASSRTDARVARRLDTTLAGAARTTFGRLRSYADSVVREARAADPTRAAIVASRFSTTLALVAVLFGRSEADAFRKRAEVPESRAS
jgi:hypothetical protein